MEEGPSLTTLVVISPHRTLSLPRKRRSSAFTSSSDSISSLYWALAIPSFGIVSVFFIMVLYLGLNFLATPPPYSLNAIYDEHSREPITFIPLEGMEKPIDLISDVGIDQINHLMFGNANL